MPRLIVNEDWEPSFRLLLKPTPSTHVRDVPYEEIEAEAQAMRAKVSDERNVVIFYKFTCTRCKYRCLHPEPDTLPKEVVCRRCAHRMPFLAGGYTFLIIAPDAQVNKDVVTARIREILQET
jgi:DNA-directed RNA polymerase subunit RPC12/RpoP